MPYPNHPEKHREEALVTPHRQREYRREHGGGDSFDSPEAVVVCYSRRLMEYVTEEYDGEPVGHYYGDLYRLDGTDGQVGVLGNFGIGAPTTAMLMDELVAGGTERFLSVGIAGCLDGSVAMGEFVVCDRAIRDEGTSHHYLEPGRSVRPDAALTDALRDYLDERGAAYRVGPSWTIDAIYRETAAEVERYASEGVLTVEMEAAAVFAVARRRGVDAASLFVVSDYLGPDDWDPKFHLTGADLHRLGDTAIDLLAGERVRPERQH